MNSSLDLNSISNNQNAYNYKSDALKYQTLKHIIMFASVEQETTFDTKNKKYWKVAKNRSYWGFN